MIRYLMIGLRLAQIAPGACPFPTPAACANYVIPTSSSVLIPINYLTGPNHFTLNLRLAKAFGFGPEVGAKNGRGRRRSRGWWSGGGGGPRGGGGGGGGGLDEAAVVGGGGARPLLDATA